MSYEIDDILFTRLAAFDPIDVCTRTGCHYNETDKVYSLRYWGDDYRVDCLTRTIKRRTSSGTEPHDYLPVFIINYLMQAKKVPLSGEWISEKDFPGGVTFFRAPHEIPTQLLSSRFRNDLETFARSCEQLGGRRLDMADSSYAFMPHEHISIAMLYWVGDEDFPAEAKLLFDKSISKSLALDTVYAFAVDACSRLSLQA